MYCAYIVFQNTFMCILTFNLLFTNKKKIKSREGAETFLNKHVLYKQFSDLIYYM